MGRHAKAWLSGHAAAVGALLFAAVVLARLPFATTQLWAWDSVLYARALELGFHVDADPSGSRPHPPGYIWYVGAAQLARAFIGDSNAALVLLSILASAAGAALLWLVASRWMGPGVALLIAAAYAASPLVWTYSEVAYPYTTLGLVSLVLGALFIDGRRPLVASLAFGLLSGVRQDILVLLAPLWLWSMWGLPPRRIAAASALTSVGVLMWWVPSAMLSGGPLAYLEALFGQTGRIASTYSVPANGMGALAYNTGFTLEALAWGLGLLAVPLLAGAGRLAARARRRTAVRPDRISLGLAIWAGPALAFYAAVHIGEWGYVLSVLPPLYLAAGLALERARTLVPSRRWLTAGVLAAVMPGVLFLAADEAHAATWGRAQFSASALAHHDASLRARVAYVRRSFPASGTVVLAREDYQLVRYYMPEYRAWYWDPDPHAPRRAKRKRAMRPTTVVVFTAGLQPLVAGDIRRVEIAPGVDLAYLVLERGSILELQGERYAVREPPGR